MQEAQAAAQAAELGQWAAELTAPPPYTAANPAALTLPVTAFVEAVLNGSTLRFTLPATSQFVTGILAGVQCPSLGRRPDAGAAEAPPEPEPFAREAKLCSETLVLHRYVQLFPLGCDNYGNLAFSLTFSSADGSSASLSEALLRSGLARVSERTLSLAPPKDVPKLRAAEEAAVKERLALWASLPRTVPSLSQRGRASVIVAEVLSGDMLVVADAASGAERRVSLASTRAPRMGNARKGEPPQPYALAAVEFLRVNLIGRTVVCEPEYVRRVGVGEDDAPERVMEFASLFEERADARAPGGVARRSVAELIVSAGLATAARHRPGEERATRYAALLAAEEAARAAKRGLHSGQEQPSPVPHDVSRDAGRARAFLASLQRAGRTVAVVDYVLSAGRLKLHVLKENVVILF